ncbi:MAG: plastocyanin/azurin family copper-binding protein [Crocinitomicaceae bacterium]
MKNFTLLSLIILVSVKCLGQTTHTVNSGSFYYTPASLTIDVGDSVVWINDGGFHDVNGANNSITNEPYNNPVIFNSDATNDIDAVIFSFKFNVPGVYNYDCSIGEHAASGMTGLVIVEAPLNSINEIISKDIYIYPVPVNDVINIHGIESLKNIKSLDILSLEGNKVLTFENSSYSYDISSLSDGVYFFVIEYGNSEKETIKFLVK